MDDFRECRSARRVETGRPGGSIFSTFLGIQAEGGNGPSSPNGLARESLNLRSMDYGGSVDMSVFR